MNLNESNILLLGATGFIGREIYSKLRVEFPKMNIYLLLRNIDKITEFEHPKTHILHGDLEYFDWNSLQNPIDFVIHAARINSSKGRKIGRLWAALKGWYGNKRLLKFVLKKNPKRIFLLSGSLMYGNSKLPHPTNVPLNPTSFAKEYIWAEKPFLKILNKKPVTILRVPWVLGKGSWFDSFYWKKIQQSGFIPLYGDGKNQMTFVTTTAIAKSIIEVIQKNDFKPVYHLNFKKSIQQTEFAELLKKHVDLPIKRIELSAFERAIREAFLSSIELIPSEEFLSINKKSKTEIELFLQELKAENIE
jgi:nucleoside-diphosphate-sugar epimerase